MVQGMEPGQTTAQATEVQGVEEPKESVEQLKAMLEQFAKAYKFAASRKARCEDLMHRKSAAEWAPEKKMRMVRRLLTANKEMEQTEGYLDQIATRLSQLGVEVDVVSRSAGEAS